MKIKRKRYAVMRKNRTEIWCGLPKNFHFVPVSELKDTLIKTYRTENQALSGCSSWDKDFEVVPILETIETDFCTIQDAKDKQIEELKQQLEAEQTKGTKLESLLKSAIDDMPRECYCCKHLDSHFCIKASGYDCENWEWRLIDKVKELLDDVDSVSD